MGLMGFWHGIALHYIVYGFYHGLLLIATNWLDRRYQGNRLLNDPGLLWRGLSILITFHLVAFSFLIFSGRLFKPKSRVNAPDVLRAPSSRTRRGQNSPFQTGYNSALLERKYE